MPEYPEFEPAGAIAKDLVSGYEQLVKRFNAAKAAMGRFREVLVAYNSRLESQVRGTGLDLTTAASSPLLQRQRLKDDLMKHVRGAQTDIGSGKIYDLLADIEKLTRELLSVNKFQDEVELLANITGVHRKVSDDLADLLAKMSNVYVSLRDVEKRV